MRELVHVDEADPAIGAGKLVLDAALCLQQFRLDAMGCGGDLVRGQPAGREGVQGADECHAHRR